MDRILSGRAEDIQLIDVVVTMTANKEAIQNELEQTQRKLEDLLPFRITVPEPMKSRTSSSCIIQGTRNFSI